MFPKLMQKKKNKTMTSEVEDVHKNILGENLRDQRIISPGKIKKNKK